MRSQHGGWSCPTNTYGERLVHGPKPRFQVPLCGSDGSLGGVGSVVSWRGELVLDVALLEVLLKVLWALVVHSVEFGLTPSLREGVVYVPNGIIETFGGLVAQGPEEDTVAVIVICNQEILVAITGCDWEPTGLFGPSRLDAEARTLRGIHGYCVLYPGGERHLLFRPDGP
jgi:hypothetical protein